MKATFVARSLLICLFCIASFTLSTGRAAAKVGRIGANNMANAATTQCGSWSIVASPNISGSDTDFGAVAAVSANDIWAVGNQANANTSIARTLTEHWNGSSWSIVSSPNIGPSGNTFYGVAAISSNDVWAVGYAVDSSTNISHTLIEHWNGSSWSIVASPNAGDAYNLLQSVTTVSSNDVWAVGYARSNGNFQTLIEHWNGSSWSVVSSPNPGTAANTLYAVHAVTVNDVWASGQYLTTDGSAQALIEHWDGSSWNVVSLSPTSSLSVFYGVAATPDHVWAVGDNQHTTSPMTTLVEQKNTNGWSIASSANVAKLDNVLFATSASDDNNAWAVGNVLNASSNQQTLIEYSQGGSWSVQKSLSPGSGDNILGGVVALSAHNVWAVGGYDNGNNTKTLVEHYC